MRSSMVAALAVGVWLAPGAAWADSEAKLPDKADFHMFLLMGQSNMVGRGRLTKVPPHPRILAVRCPWPPRATSPPNVVGMQWAPAVDPLHLSGGIPCTVGPGVSFAQCMLKVVDEDVTLGLIPVAVGGSFLKDWPKGGVLYERAVDYARAAMKVGTLTGVLWHHGEADAQGEGRKGKKLWTARTYGKRLYGMIADLRRELGNPKLPFVAGEPWKEFGLGDPSRPGVELGIKLVRQAILDLPEKVPNTAVVNSAGFRHTHADDKVHFTTEAQREGGLRYAREMAKLLGYPPPRGEASGPAANAGNLRCRTSVRWSANCSTHRTSNWQSSRTDAGGG